MTDERGARRGGVQSVVDRKTSAVDLVLHEIRRSILSGELPPGQPFTVPALTEQLGVSHARSARPCASWRPRASSC